MTWEEYRERAVRLARAFEELGQNELARNWWEGARIAGERIERKRRCAVQPGFLITELEQDEQRAVQLIADRLEQDQGSRLDAARGIFGRMH